jgi:hypothetical protein
MSLSVSSSIMSRLERHDVNHLVVVAAVVVVITTEVTAEALLKVAVRLLLVGVVLVVLAVLLVVELLNVLLGVTLGLLAVDEVGALGLGKTVDLTTSEAGEELLGEAVRYRLACWSGQWLMAVYEGEVVSSYPPSSACPRTSSWP